MLRPDVRKPIKKDLREILEDQQIPIKIEKEWRRVSFYRNLRYWTIIPTFAIRTLPLQLDVEWLCWELVISYRKQLLIKNHF